MTTGWGCAGFEIIVIAKDGIGLMVRWWQIIDKLVWVRVMRLLRIRLVVIRFVNVTIIQYVMVIVVLVSMRLANPMAQYGRIMILVMFNLKLLIVVVIEVDAYFIDAVIIEFNGVIVVIILLVVLVVVLNIFTLVIIHYVFVIVLLDVFANDVII